MQKEITAALKAAKARTPRNEGDRSESELVVALLTDCLAHAGPLDDLADAYDRAQKIREAQDALREAETA